MVNDETYFQREARRILETEKGIRDNYNTLTDQTDLSNIHHVLSNNDESRKPHPNETLAEYSARASWIQHTQEGINTKTHILNGKKIWYTHRAPNGCFMCKDLEFIRILVDVLKYISIKYPKIKFNS